MMIGEDFKKFYYVIPLRDRNEGDQTWLHYQDWPAKFLAYDLRIYTPAHGWRHIEHLGYRGCLIKITYTDDHGDGWYFFKKPESLVTVEMPDDPDLDPNYESEVIEAAREEFAREEDY